jgi:transposase-like protein
VPKLATIWIKHRVDVLAFMSFPIDHRTKIRSINPLERLNGDTKRRTDVVGTLKMPSRDWWSAPARTERRISGFDAAA